jgi:hypothetical protein
VLRKRPSVSRSGPPDRRKPATRRHEQGLDSRLGWIPGGATLLPLPDEPDVRPKRHVGST